MADLEQMVPFLWVTSMERSIRHYVDGLGFAIKHEWIDDGKLRWCWLVRGAVALMLQEYRDGAKPDGKLGAGVGLCVTCGDAIAIFRELRGRGIAAGEPVVGNRFWVTTVVDPDGYKMDFESPTDVAEDTKLSDLPAFANPSEW